MTPPRRPFPQKPRTEVAGSLRRALVSAWSEVRLGRHGLAVGRLEAEVMAAVCDLEALTVEEWERLRVDLQAVRPDGGLAAAVEAATAPRPSRPSRPPDA